MSNLVIEKNIPLAPLTTLKIGGPTDFFVKVSSVTQLLEALKIARDSSWPVFILAGGSNLIISDTGFRGLVIKLAFENWKLLTENCQLTAEAGVPMSKIVDGSIVASLSGLEWAGGLPGTFGGAIRGNAGCYGAEIKDSILSVRSVEIKTGAGKLRDRAGCQFGYRDSIFKHRSEIIVEATLQLSAGDRTELRAIADSHIKQRQERHPLEYPNAGSIFKNVPIERMPKEYLPLFAESIKNDPFPVVPTAKIIVVASLKGLKVGQAELSQKHSNMIVNLGGATAKDVTDLIELIRSKIRTLYQVELEVEPELVGF